MKHRINAITKLCTQCGLAANQNTTTHCAGHQLRSDTIKSVINGNVDYINGGWISLIKPMDSKPVIQQTPAAKSKVIVAGNPPTEIVQIIKSIFGEDAVIEFDKENTDSEHLEVSEPETIGELLNALLSEDEDKDEELDESIPENEVLLTDDEVAFMFCLVRDEFPNADILASREATAVYQSLVRKGLVVNCGSHAHLSPKGEQHIAKLLSIAVE